MFTYPSRSTTPWLIWYHDDWLVIFEWIVDDKTSFHPYRISNNLQQRKSWRVPYCSRVATNCADLSVHQIIVGKSNEWRMHALAGRHLATTIHRIVTPSLRYSRAGDGTIPGITVTWAEVCYIRRPAGPFIRFANHAVSCRVCRYTVIVGEFSSPVQ